MGSDGFRWVRMGCDFKEISFSNKMEERERESLLFFSFFFLFFLQPNSRKRKRKLRARRQISNASPNWRRPSISVGSPDWRVGRSKSTNDFFYWPSSFSSPAHLLVGTALFRVWINLFFWYFSIFTEFYLYFFYFGSWLDLIVFFFDFWWIFFVWFEFESIIWFFTGFDRVSSIFYRYSLVSTEFGSVILSSFTWCYRDYWYIPFLNVILY